MLDNTPIVLALGFFDSVHLGHKNVIETARNYAIKNGHKSVVFTFKNNVKSVLLNQVEQSVFTINEREKIILSLGVDGVYKAPCSKSFLNKGYLSFLSFLNKKFNVKAYVCGYDYTFGKNAKGTVSLLEKYAKSNNQKLILVEDKIFNGRKISTTNIKSLLLEGKIETVNKMLVNPFFIENKVISGRKIGKNLGFPTVNLEIPQNKTRLKNGVYYGHAIIKDIRYNAVINYGTIPTFNIDKSNVEAHLINFDGNLYNKKIKLYFDGFIRDIIKFKDKNQLKNQIEKDIKYIKETND